MRNPRTVIVDFCTNGLIPVSFVHFQRCSIL